MTEAAGFIGAQIGLDQAERELAAISPKAAETDSVESAEKLDHVHRVMDEAGDRLDVDTYESGARSHRLLLEVASDVLGGEPSETEGSLYHTIWTAFSGDKAATTLYDGKYERVTNDKLPNDEREKLIARWARQLNSDEHRLAHLEDAEARRAKIDFDDPNYIDPLIFAVKEANKQNPALFKEFDYQAWQKVTDFWEKAIEFNLFWDFLLEHGGIDPRELDPEQLGSAINLAREITNRERLIASYIEANRRFRHEISETAERQLEIDLDDLKNLGFEIDLSTIDSSVLASARKILRQLENHDYVRERIRREQGSIIARRADARLFDIEQDLWADLHDILSEFRAENSRRLDD